MSHIFTVASGKRSLCVILAGVLRLFKFEVPEEQHINPENTRDLRMKLTRLDPEDLVRQLNSAATEGGFFSDMNQ